MKYSTFIKRLRVLVINTRTGRIQERNLFSLREVCTGNDFDTIVADLRDSGISESKYSRIELI